MHWRTLTRVMYQGLNCVVCVILHWKLLLFMQGLCWLSFSVFTCANMEWSTLLSSDQLLFIRLTDHLRLPVIIFAFFFCTSVCADKSRAFSPLGDGKKVPVADDIRAMGMGRPVMSAYQLSPRDMAKLSQDQLLHYNPCKTTSTAHLNESLFWRSFWFTTVH